MSPLRKFLLTLGGSSLSLVLAIACTQDPLGNSQSDLVATKKGGPRAFQGGCSGSADVVDTHEVGHYALKHSAIGEGASDVLAVSGGKGNTAFGLCSQMVGDMDGPMAGAIVDFAQSCGLPMGGDFLAVLRGAQGATTRLGIIAHEAAEAFFGFVSDDDPDHFLHATVRRNGELVNTVNGRGQVRFALPRGFRLTGWAGNQNRSMLRGRDAGNLWEATVERSVALPAITSLVQRFKGYSDRSFCITIIIDL